MPRRAVLVAAILAVAGLLLSASWNPAQASCTVPGISGNADANGIYPMKVETGIFDPDALASLFRANGCNATSFFVYREGKVVSYHTGAPESVKAIFRAQGFPAYLREGEIFLVGTEVATVARPVPTYPTGFAPLVRPRAEEVPLKYVCGGSSFEVTGWFLPEYLTDRRQQATVTVTYKVPADGTNYNISILLETSVGVIPGVEVAKFVKDPKLMRELGLDPEGRAGGLNTNIPSYFITTPDFPGQVGHGIKDGQFHKVTHYIYNVYTALEYDRGAPHQSSVEGWLRSYYSASPFYLQIPPYIVGSWDLAGQTWRIDTHDADYCKEPVVNK